MKFISIARKCRLTDVKIFSSVLLLEACFSILGMGKTILFIASKLWLPKIIQCRCENCPRPYPIGGFYYFCIARLYWYFILIFPIMPNCKLLKCDWFLGLDFLPEEGAFCCQPVLTGKNRQKMANYERSNFIFLGTMNFWCIQ